MKDKNLHFSIIIPTKDRAQYLAQTLRTCSMQNYENLEIIVSDDGSVDDTKEVVMDAAFKDRRIAYVTPGSNVGMKANFEFALSKVKPGYVLALGGDDGLLPYAIEGIRDTILSTGMQLVTWSAPIYSYANSSTVGSQLILHKKSNSRIVNSQNFLERQAQNLSYINDPEIPMFYVKGVAATQLIDRVKSRSENKLFYNCATPDGYSGIVLAGEVDSFAYSGTPFSIYGTSPSSQGLRYLLGDEDSKILSKSFFDSVVEWPMHEELGSQPYSPLIALMTADYLLNAQKLSGWPGKFSEINFKTLLLNGLNELSHGLYSKERMTRELKILESIARYHNLSDFYRSRVCKIKKYVSRPKYEGNGINLKSYFIDCEILGVKNIYDASYLAYNLNAISSKIGGNEILSAIKKSIVYKLKSKKKDSHFPREEEWSID